MSDRIFNSDLLLELSTEEQQLLAGGRCVRPPMTSVGGPGVGNNNIGTNAIPSNLPAGTIIAVGGPGVGNNNIGISQY